MSFLFRQVQHLTRYFLIFSLLVFVLYWQDINRDLAFLFIGPPLYIAYYLKDILAGYIEFESSRPINLFAFILPVNTAYYGLVGFQIKKIWNEQGFVRTITLLALVGFLFFIHFLAWRHLTGYYQLPS